MAQVKVRRSELADKKAWAVPTGQSHTFTLAPPIAQVIEFEDVHFHHDSAVLLPDYGPLDQSASPERRINGLAVLIACLQYAQEHPAKKLLATGHADTTGGDAYNVTLSAERANNVVRALSGERDAWVQSAQAKSKVEDYQQILKFVAWLWGWPCDPGPVDGQHGDGTDRAVRAFQELASAEFGKELSVDGRVGAQTWGAIFDFYMRAIADQLEISADELSSLQASLPWLMSDKRGVGCGESFPIEALGVDNFRSETNRRVELLFFDPLEDPPFPCHPAADRCVPGSCKLYPKQQNYTFQYLPPDPISLEPAQLTLQIQEILGLYKPGHVDAAEPKAAGYLANYKSEDDAGRIFLNTRPRSSDSESWSAIHAKDKQYVELTVQVTGNRPSLPSGLRVQWTWEHPDTPANAAIQRLVDGQVAELDLGFPPSGDNLGRADHPSAGAADGARFEELPGYALSAGDSAQVCSTRVADGISKVRMHCTNVGGDSFRVRAELVGGALVVPGAKDETGMMTLWKRIDVEYRKMESAADLPVDQLAEYFEACFVQMDIDGPHLDPDVAFMSNSNAELELAASNYAKQPPTGHFDHEGQPGWFLLVAAMRGVQGVDSSINETLYTGMGTVAEALSGGERVETITVETTFAEPTKVKGILLTQGGKKVYHRVFGLRARGGRTTLTLEDMDIQAEFRPAHGSLNEAHDHELHYYPRHVRRVPGNAWLTPGMGLPAQFTVEVLHKVPEVGGISPPNASGGRDYFAGRTIIYTGHPSYSQAGVLNVDKVLRTIVHEFGHAFGFPHKCGYYAWDSADDACCMNYFNTWLHASGTRNLQPFVTGNASPKFCARHVHAIRRVHLEDNPALWSWP